MDPIVILVVVLVLVVLALAVALAYLLGKQRSAPTVELVELRRRDAGRDRRVDELGATVARLLAAGNTTAAAEAMLEAGVAREPEPYEVGRAADDEEAAEARALVSEGVAGSPLAALVKRREGAPELGEARAILAESVSPAEYAEAVAELPPLEDDGAEDHTGMGSIPAEQPEANAPRRGGEPDPEGRPDPPPTVLPVVRRSDEAAAGPVDVPS